MYAEQEDLERKHLVCFTDEACEPHELPMYVLTPTELAALKREVWNAARDGKLLYESDEPGTEGYQSVKFKYDTFEEYETKK